MTRPVCVSTGVDFKPRALSHVPEEYLVTARSTLGDCAPWLIYGPIKWRRLKVCGTTVPIIGGTVLVSGPREL